MTELFYDVVATFNYWISFFIARFNYGTEHLEITAILTYCVFFFILFLCFSLLKYLFDFIRGY